MKQAESYIASATQRPNYCLTVLKVRCPCAATAAVAVALLLLVNGATALPLISRARLGCTTSQISPTKTLSIRASAGRSSPAARACRRQVLLARVLRLVCQRVVAAFGSGAVKTRSCSQRCPVHRRRRHAPGGCFKTGGGLNGVGSRGVHRSWWRRRRRHWRCGRRQA